MKKLIKLVVSLSLVLSMFCGMAFPVAAAGETITAEVVGSYTVSDASQDITVRINISGLSAAYCGFSIASVTLPDGFSVKSYSTSNSNQAITAGDYNASTGALTYMTSDMEDTIAANTYYDLVISAPAGASGNYEVQFANVIVSSMCGSNEMAKAETLSAVVNIADTTAAEGYTASLGSSSNNNEVASNGAIIVNVGVSHSEDTVFNAGEIKLEYNATQLNPNTTELDAMVTAGTLSGYKNENGELTIESFGSGKTMPYTYGIPFTASEVTQDTASAVTLSSAKFVHKDDAKISDLIAATNVPLTLDVTIKAETVDVTLTENGGSTTTSSILKGQDYTFAPTDTDNYTYTNVQAKVNNTLVTITPSADGKSFTIAGADVTGDIVITYDKNPNVYNVTVVEPEGHEGKVGYDEQATYGTEYTFTIPKNTEATKTDAGYTYSATVTVNGATYNAERDGLEYTIAGGDISGDIEITLVVQETPALGLDTYTVTVQGSTDVKVNSEDSVTITEGEEVTLTLSPEAGYIYEIKVNNEVVTLEDNSYTFTVTSNVTVAVTKNLDVSTVQVFEYATMDTVGSAWLITFDGTLAAGKIPTYDGNLMYWSAKYDAYCYLEIAATLSADGSDDVPGAKSKIGVTTATAPVVDYGMDINGTGVTDAADAQMIWNMYSAEYNSFDEGDTTVDGVAMEKFLAADQNATSSDTANWKLTVEDAQVIIAAILAGNATT